MHMQKPAPCANREPARISEDIQNVTSTITKILYHLRAASATGTFVSEAVIFVPKNPYYKTGDDTMKKQTINSPIIRVALYIRVSSEEQAKHGDSIRDQKETGLDYISSHSNMALQDIYIDDGVSGQKLDRDDFTRLMQNVKAGMVDMIIFTKLDRWFRSLRHYLNTQEILEKHNVSWLAINQPYFDTSTPYGRAFVAQSMTWAELEAQNGGQRVKDVFSSKVEHGEVITGKTPRGYHIVNKHLELTEEAPIILQAFQTTWDSQSFCEGWRFLTDHGIIMTFNNFRASVLANEKYVGRYRNNPNYCPPIVPDELFNNIQDMINRCQNVTSNQRYDYIFSGLLVCAHCGYRLSSCQLNSSRKLADGSRKHYRYPGYKCHRWRQMKSCSNNGELRETKMEAYLLSRIKLEIENHIAQYITAEAPIIDNRQKKQSLQRKMEKLKTLFLNDLITLEEYKAEHDSYMAQLEQMPDIILPNNNIEHLKQLLNMDFETIYSTFSNTEKRFFWRSILKEIRVTRTPEHTWEFELIFL